MKKINYLVTHWHCSGVVITERLHFLKIIALLLSCGVVHLTDSIDVIVVERETSMMAETPSRTPYSGDARYIHEGLTA